jgi:hypothetical protein
VLTHFRTTQIAYEVRKKAINPLKTMLYKIKTNLNLNPEHTAKEVVSES